MNVCIYLRRLRSGKKIETDLKSAPQLFFMGIKNYNVFVSFSKINTKCKAHKKIENIELRLL